MIKIKTDFSSFKHGTIIVAAKVTHASEAGMKAAMKEYMSDCQNVSPTVPRRTGDLAGSHSIFVGSMLVGVSRGGKNPTPLTAFINTLKGIVGTLIVHKPYAASIHEGVSRHGTPYIYQAPGSGKKWVEAKIIRFTNKYFSLIARRIKITK